MTACEVCGGACCKVFFVGKSILNQDAAKWLALHGTEDTKRVRFDIPCSALKSGKCSIYESRPQMCKDAEVGGSMCLEAINIVQPERLEEIKTYFGGQHGTE